MELPDDLIPGAEISTADASVTDGQLQKLILTSQHATIAFTPGR